MIMEDKNKNQKGYTIVELVVAMTIFILAVTMISGLFVRSIKTQRQANHLTVLNSDSSLILERMNREIREGYNFSEPNQTGRCEGDLEFSRVVNGSEKEVTYRFNEGNIERREGSNAPYHVLNSSESDIRYTCFLLTQSDSEEPWRITVSMKVGSIDPNINYSANIQTTVTARSLPCEANGRRCGYQ